MAKRFKTNSKRIFRWGLQLCLVHLLWTRDENSEALRLLLKDEERPKRLRENDFGGDTNDTIAIAEEFTKTVAVIATAGNRMLHRSSTGSDLLYERRFRAHFGCRIVYSCFRRLRKVLSSNVTENTHMGL